jgi:hypothetical protein
LEVSRWVDQNSPNSSSPEQDGKCWGTLGGHTSFSKQRLVSGDTVHTLWTTLRVGAKCDLRFTTPIGNLQDVHYPSAATIKRHTEKIREDSRVSSEECHFNAPERWGQEVSPLPAGLLSIKSTKPQSYVCSPACYLGLPTRNNLLQTTWWTSCNGRITPANMPVNICRCPATGRRLATIVWQLVGIPGRRTDPVAHPNQSQRKVA